jgi:hypothetical protein
MKKNVIVESGKEQYQGIILSLSKENKLIILKNKNRLLIIRKWDIIKWTK